MTHQPQSFRRRRLNTTAKAKVRIDGQSDWQVAQATNLSPSGMFLRSVDPKPVGTLVHFELELSQEEGASAGGVGEVMWSRQSEEGPNKPPGVGIRFQTLEDGCREAILRMMSGSTGR